MKKIFTLLLIVCILSSFAQSTLRCYRDADLDGYGDPNNSTPPIPNQGCPFGYVQDNTDCDDNNAVVHHIIWYKDSDGDGFGDGTSIESCLRPTGYVGQLFFAEID